MISDDSIYGKLRSIHKKTSLKFFTNHDFNHFLTIVEDLPKQDNLSQELGVIVERMISDIFQALTNANLDYDQKEYIARSKQTITEKGYVPCLPVVEYEIIEYDEHEYSISKLKKISEHLGFAFNLSVFENIDGYIQILLFHLSTITHSNPPIQSCFMRICGNFVDGYSYEDIQIAISKYITYQSWSFFSRDHLEYVRFKHEFDTYLDLVNSIQSHSDTPL